MKVAILTTDNREHDKDYDRPSPFFGAAPQALLEGFARMPDLEVHVVSCLRESVKSPEKLADNIRYHSLVVPKIGWMSTGYQGCIRAVRKKLREIKPNMVHGQGTERDCAISAVFSGFPNAVTIHGNMAELARLFHARMFGFHWLAARLEDMTLPRTAGVFCNSTYTESLVRPRAKKTWRVPNPIRSEFFRRPNGRSEHSVPAILNVGVVSPRKRQLEILDLARGLHQEGCRVKFLFVGALSAQSEYGAKFHSSLQEAEQAGYGSYLGTRSTGNLTDLFDECDAMLHFPTEEAFGLVAAESLARNLKFFGAAIGGVVEICSGVELTELYPANDWQSLKSGIIRWLEQGCPKPKGAAELMAARYHPDIIARRHVEIYHEVLGR